MAGGPEFASGGEESVFIAGVSEPAHPLLPDVPGYVVKARQVTDRRLITPDTVLRHTDEIISASAAEKPAVLARHEQEFDAILGIDTAGAGEQ